MSSNVKHVIILDFNTQACDLLDEGQYVRLVQKRTSETDVKFFLSVFDFCPATARKGDGYIKITRRDGYSKGKERNTNNKPFYSVNMSLDMVRARLPMLDTGNFVYSLDLVPTEHNACATFELKMVRKTQPGQTEGIGIPGVGISRVNDWAK